MPHRESRPSIQKQQDSTGLSGIWPIIVNPKDTNFRGGVGSDYSLGAMADSLYEYLPKEFMLLGGLHLEYRLIYEKVIARAKESLFFRPLTQGNLDILISGTVHVEEHGIELDTQGQHLVCFVGGMVAMAARLFKAPKDLEVARKLVDGCIWSYGNTVTGLMPEIFHAIPCPNSNCQWDAAAWHRTAMSRAKDFRGPVEALIKETHLSPGFSDIPDRRYVLRPEAIEAIFVLYRTTGDEVLREKAWTMFEAVEKYTRTEIAHTVFNDVTAPEAPQDDRMETFWTAETLKYFYLLFFEPDVISLDDYVFNTEAHPFKIPKRQAPFNLPFVSFA